MLLATMASPGAAIAQTCGGQCPLAALFLPVTAAAGDQTNSPRGADPEWLPPSPSFLNGGPTGSIPRWTLSAEAIVLGRLGGADQALVGRVPGSVPFDLTSVPGVEAFNSNQFQPAFSAGPKVDLIYRLEPDYGVEFSYFNIFDQNASKVIGPDSPADWLVMKAPGTFWQTQDFPYQGMAWSAATNLYSAEANGRFDLSSRVTILAGLRWLQLNDNLVGTLTPADLTQPNWKKAAFPGYTLSQVAQLPPDGTAGNYPPFWNTGTTNNLYGVQIGADGKILQLGRFSLDGLIKIGAFANNAEQSTGVSLQKIVYPSTAATTNTAFVSEASLQLKYQLVRGLALKAGYEVLWLAGVALAPGQIQETFTTPSSVRAIGVNFGSNTLFQGGTFGLEYSF